MPSIDEFSTAIGAAAASVEAATSAIAAAKSSGDELSGQFSDMGAEGKSSETDNVAQRLETEAAAIAMQLKDLLGEIRQQAEGLRGLPGGATGPRAISTPAATPRFDARPTIDRLPEFTKTRGHRSKTRGILQTDNGQRHELVSGTDQTTQQVREHMWGHLGTIRRPHTFGADSDVELKAAVIMAENHLRHGDIAINNPRGPCIGDFGCDTLLPRYLPPGATLTVHWADTDGVLRSRTYTGTIE